MKATREEEKPKNTPGRFVFVLNKRNICTFYEFQQEEEYWERRPVPDKNDVSVCIK